MVGLESRSSILPEFQVDQGPGVLGPDYDFSDNLPLPGDIGVKAGDSFGSVMDAVKGAAYYVDMIGFGQSSTSLTRGMPLTPLGVNYFVKTGQKCPNGEPMYAYIQGIPKGDALGKRIQAAMASSGLPALRGLGPGIIEDAKDALDPTPILNATFGSGYPDCVEIELPVGDQFLQIKNPTTGKFYITEPKTAYQKNGIWVQRRWIQKTNRRGDVVFLTKEQYDAAGGGKPPEKEAFLDGYRSLGRKVADSWTESWDEDTKKSVGYAALGVCALIGGYMTWRWIKQRKN